MKRFPIWYLAASGALLVLWITTGIFYHMGAYGVTVKSKSGASVTFDRKADMTMFKVNDEMAYSVSMGMVFYSKYRKASAPFCYICGMYEPVGQFQQEGDLPGFPGVTKALELTPEQIAEKFEPISVMNESCLIFQTAFFFIFVVMLIIGGVLIIRRKQS